MKTRYYKQLKMLLCSALLFTSAGGTAQAGIPVIDSGTIAQAIENNVNLVLELKSVKNIVELAGKMSTTMGEALSTFNEYVETYYSYKDGIENSIENSLKNIENSTGLELNPNDLASGITGQSPTGGAGLTSSLTGSGTNNGFSVLPNELSEFCNLSASDITKLEDKPKVIECLKKLITLRNNKDKDAQREARDIYVKAFHETAYANIAEAIVMRNYAVNYEKEVLEPLTEKLKKAKTVRDDYSGVIMVNKEVANLVNKVLMIYSSKVAYDAFRDYGDFEIYPEDLLNIGDSKS